MNCLHTTALTPAQKKEVQALVLACRTEEPLTLSAPLEEGLDYFLCYEGELLCSMLFLFFPEETLCECSGFTLPSFRRRGYFSCLLEAALSYVDSKEEASGTEIDFCFITDDRTPSAAAVMKALDAGYWYSEYSMERPLTGADCAFQGVLTIQDMGDHLYAARSGDQTVGVCMIIPSGKSVYFYGFEIKEPFRHKGFGRDFLSGMLKLLAPDYQTITLQVSSLNTAALSLYKKTGFSITETLSCYLY